MDVGSGFGAGVLEAAVTVASGAGAEGLGAGSTLVVAGGWFEGAGADGGLEGGADAACCWLSDIFWIVSSNMEGT